jgi:hypothetical protein
MAPLNGSVGKRDTIVVEEDVRLPKPGEYLIKGMIRQEGINRIIQEEERIFIPDVCNLMKRSTMAATSLVKYNIDGTIPVRIMTGESITLYKGTRLGTTDQYSPEIFLRSIGMEDMETESKIDILHVFQNQLKRMPEKHAEIMKGILVEYSDIFSKSKMDLGCAVGVEHQILTENTPPITLNYRRTPVALEEKVDELIEKLVQQKIIRPSQSPWNAPVVVVKKKNGDIRMCVDYRWLNAVTLRPIFPIPDAVQLFDALESAKYFTSLDL